MKRFKHPFTLVELLCVIIVIALLAAISVKVTQVAYRRADETKTKTVMEIIRTVNEQYKAKNGYYLPSAAPICDSNFIVSAEKASTGYCRIKFVNTDFADYLGDAYEMLRSMPVKKKSDGKTNEDYIRDAWGNEIRYKAPGRYNEGTYDLYSIGRDEETYISNSTNIDTEKSTLKKEGFGDDVTNFSLPR